MSMFDASVWETTLAASKCFQALTMHVCVMMSTAVCCCAVRQRMHHAIRAAAAAANRPQTRHIQRVTADRAALPIRLNPADA
jgi:hypothetical protein